MPSKVSYKSIIFKNLSSDEAWNRVTREAEETNSPTSIVCANNDTSLSVFLAHPTSEDTMVIKTSHLILTKEKGWLLTEEDTEKEKVNLATISNPNLFLLQSAKSLLDILYPLLKQGNFIKPEKEDEKANSGFLIYITQQLSDLLVKKTPRAQWKPDSGELKIPFETTGKVNISSPGNASKKMPPDNQEAAERGKWEYSPIKVKGASFFSRKPQSTDENIPSAPKKKSP